MKQEITLYTLKNIQLNDINIYNWYAKATTMHSLQVLEEIYRARVGSIIKIVYIIQFWFFWYFSFTYSNYFYLCTTCLPEYDAAGFSHNPRDVAKLLLQPPLGLVHQPKQIIEVFCWAYFISSQFVLYIRRNHIPLSRYSCISL